MNRKLESLQRRALTTMLGRAAAPGAKVNGRALEVVFGELSMEDRRWLDRLRYAYSLHTIRVWVLGGQGETTPYRQSQ